MRFMRCVALLMGLLLLVAGCGGSDDKADESTPTNTETTAADGTTLPGAELELGEPATVNFVGAKAVSQVELIVRSITAGKQADLAQFNLPPAAQDSGVFYVTASVRNLTKANLAGEQLTLFGKATDTLVVRPVMFGSTFSKCNYEPLPKLGKGKLAKVCMVMLAPKHGKISAVEWRASDDELPITWAAP